MASMPTIQMLKEEAESLGLTGDAVPKYCLDQQAVARDERAREREHSAKMKELESNEADKVRAHELAMAQLANNSTNNEANNSNVSYVADPPVIVSESAKLPVFKDNEDITSYLIRFERIASLLNVDVDTYAARLGALLTGKAVDIYASLPPDITGNYERLKSSLLLAFRKTPDVYRTEFKNSQPSVHESYEQFVSQLGRKLDYWLDSNKVEKEYDSLREFIIKDQLLASVPAELRLYLKERGSLPLVDLVILADNWMSAHRSRLEKNSQRNKANRSGTNPSKPNIGAQPMNANSNSQESLKCYACGAQGHTRRNCHQNPSLNKPVNQKIHNINICLEESPPLEFLSSGTVNDSYVSTIYRDTGCSSIIVANEVLPNVDVSKCKTTKVSDYLGNVSTFPIVRCYIKCDFFEGFADAIRAPIKFCSVLLGNIPGVKNNDPANTNNHSYSRVLAVKTSPSRQLLTPQGNQIMEPLNVTPKQFAELQKSCAELSGIREKLATQEIIEARDGLYQFQAINDLIYSVCLHSSTKTRIGKKLLVVPAKLRKRVIMSALETLVNGNISRRKTKKKIAGSFYWPQICYDIRYFCRLGVSRKIRSRYLRINADHIMSEYSHSKLLDNNSESYRCSISKNYFNSFSSPFNNYLLRSECR